MYEIHIGKAISANNLHETIPIQKIVITTDQFEIIKMFAETKRDKDFNIVYRLNDVEFTVVPHFTPKKEN